MNEQTRDGSGGLSATDIFNSAVAATAIGAAWEVGGLDELHEREALDVAEFAARNELDATATTAMFRALAAVGIVRREGGRVTKGPGFAEAYEAKQFFYWLCQGSWELFGNMPFVLRHKNRSGAFYRRDAKAISHASREANRKYFDPLFWEVLESLDFAFASVTDLGSGSGERLIQIGRRYPAVRGLGLDVETASVEMAALAVEGSGMADRISFACADVRAIEPRPEFADVELLTCFMMGHDLWPKEDCVESLRRLRRAFPRARRFLLGDTVRTTGIADAELPIFTLGFEVGHALMDVYVPTRAEWHEVFEAGGWRCLTEHVNDRLAGTVVFELESVKS
ncbi:methyltransferase domain-containing protein [Amycolatopsis sp.]|uniref:methyltransferase domain-containing protein n=1 Tax=Amycolatopsis sp. TaxID=37632 RepID=UPI002D7F8795|nr:methyltransferase domain-containing protein [Amycolatopsis sp.]HET6711179.1 methyltransferase domain-containing protein [Amycolatopsis sp.]